MLVGMKDDTHNEPDTWSPLAAVTTRLLNKILETPFTGAVAAAPPSEHSEKKQSDGRAEGAAETQRKERADEAKGEYVEQRLRDYRAFEDRASGRVVKRKF